MSLWGCFHSRNIYICEEGVSYRIRLQRRLHGFVSVFFTFRMFPVDLNFYLSSHLTHLKTVLEAKNQGFEFLPKKNNVVYHGYFELGILLDKIVVSLETSKVYTIKLQKIGIRRFEFVAKAQFL